MLRRTKQPDCFSNCRITFAVLLISRKPHQRRHVFKANWIELLVSVKAAHDKQPGVIREVKLRHGNAGVLGDGHAQEFIDRQSGKLVRAGNVLGDCT